jgi:hypothetical protein
LIVARVCVGWRQLAGVPVIPIRYTVPLPGTMQISTTWSWATVCTVEVWPVDCAPAPRSGNAADNVAIATRRTVRRPMMTCAARI